jgi:hypothetical protein
MFLVQRFICCLRPGNNKNGGVTVNEVELYKIKKNQKFKLQVSLKYVLNCTYYEN